MIEFFMNHQAYAELSLFLFRQLQKPLGKLGNRSTTYRSGAKLAHVFPDRYLQELSKHGHFRRLKDNLQGLSEMDLDIVVL